MTIKKAVDHLVFKFNKVWNVTDNDVSALETIMKFVEEKHKKQLQDYHLFTKLYIMVYAQFLDRYKATVFDDIPKKELSKYLNQPLEVIIQRFTDRLNESELYALYSDLDIDLKHPITKNDIEHQRDLKALENALKDENNKDRLFGKVWNYETVKDNLELQVNNVINILK